MMMLIMMEAQLPGFLKVNSMYDFQWKKANTNFSNSCLTDFAPESCPDHILTFWVKRFTFILLKPGKIFFDCVIG